MLPLMGLMSRSGDARVHGSWSVSPVVLRARPANTRVLFEAMLCFKYSRLLHLYFYMASRGALILLEVGQTGWVS